MMANRTVLAQVMILAVTAIAISILIAVIGMVTAAAGTRMLRGCVNSLLKTYLNLLETYLNAKVSVLESTLPKCNLEKS